MALPAKNKSKRHILICAALACVCLVVVFTVYAKTRLIPSEKRTEEMVRTGRLIGVERQHAIDALRMTVIDDDGTTVTLMAASGPAIGVYIVTLQLDASGRVVDAQIRYD